MIKHIVTMVWNRKRANGLIVLEIAVSFLVLFSVCALGAFSLANARRPLGYTWRNVISAQMMIRDDGEHTVPGSSDLMKRLLATVRELPGVEAAGVIDSAPFVFSNNVGGLRDLRAGDIMFERNAASDSLPEVLGLTVTRGRWFSREDRGTRGRPVVINENMARLLFGSEDPVGKPLFQLGAKAEAEYGQDEERVVGVIADFRRGGELSSDRLIVFDRADLDDPEARPPLTLLVRVRPGTPRSFEESLAAAIQAVAHDVSVEIAPLEEMRATMLLVSRTPVIAASVIGGFLMIMVGLGLTGVLWQNVTQRTKEIGLRRAKGATRGDIHVQILGELFVIASIGIVLGGVVALQFPLLGLLGSSGGAVTAAGLAASAAILYALTVLCGLYPSRLAARIQPAEALHYE